MICECGFRFSGPGEFRNCEAFIVEEGSCVVCPDCGKKYLDGMEYEVEKA